jgi:hypothetical protein
MRPPVQPVKSVWLVKSALSDVSVDVGVVAMAVGLNTTRCNLVRVCRFSRRWYDGCGNLRDKPELRYIARTWKGIYRLRL